ncbi:MAG: ATP-binding protein [Ktedonobacteraceae bacterium]
MSIQAILVSSHLLLIIVLALSIFNLLTFLWLALTVWLNGDRHAWITRLGFVGLSFSALFFFIHSLLISSPLGESAGLISQNFLWRLIWLPAIAVPYIWFAIGLHYAALMNEKWRRRRPVLLVGSAILGGFIIAMLIVFRATFTFTGTLQLLAYGDLSGNVALGVLSGPVLLPVLFLFYVALCAIGPWFTPGRVGRFARALWREMSGKLRRGQNGEQGKSNQNTQPPLYQVLSQAFWDDVSDTQMLREPQISWQLARPVLFLAANVMVLLTVVLAFISVSSLTNWFAFQQNPRALPPLQIIPTSLLVLDLFTNVSVSLIILLIGYSVVRHGILVERPLARRGFLEQWRGIVLMTTAVALFIAFLVPFTHSNAGSLLLIALLVTGVYALFTWSSYTAHDRYIALLGPFLRSTSVRHWLRTDARKTEDALEALFIHLCKNVLAVQYASLAVMAGPVRRNFNYRWPNGADVVGAQFIVSTNSAAPANPIAPVSFVSSDHHLPTRISVMVNGERLICWVLPIYDDLGLVAMLYLGPRQDGSAFTDEDMDLAHACGQRILDTLSDHEAMQAVAALLRRRIVNVKLLDAQHRRILHDDILPQMHLALLRMETLRYLDGAPTEVAQSEHKDAAQAEQLLRESIDLISDAHRRLAAMMRASAPSAPHRLEHDGLMNAIHAMLEQDFRHAFDEVTWDISEATMQHIDEVTPPAIAELIFAAVQESLRNAARHGRGADIHRRLRVTLKASCGYPDSGLELIVADDGVGILSAGSSTTGTSGGLLTHSALLAIAGGDLTVKSVPNGGVTVRICLPAESLR